MSEAGVLRVPYAVVKAASDSGEGNIAFADPRVYYGYYNSEYDKVNITGTSADVTISGSKIVYNDAGITTADELKAEILKITDTRDVKVYTDSGKTAFGLGSSSVVTLVPTAAMLSAFVLSAVSSVGTFFSSASILPTAAVRSSAFAY